MSMKNFSPGERLFAADLNDNFNETQKGENITSGVVAANRVANLPASKINSGTFNADRIPNLDASKVTSGSFNAARIPNLDAGKITSGTFADARIPNLNASKITAGTFNEARIPYRIRTGRLPGAAVAANTVLITTVTFPANSFTSTPRVIVGREYGSPESGPQTKVTFACSDVTSTGFTYYRGNDNPVSQTFPGLWAAIL